MPPRTPTPVPELTPVLLERLGFWDGLEEAGVDPILVYRIPSKPPVWSIKGKSEPRSSLAETMRGAMDCIKRRRRAGYGNGEL